MSTPLSLPRFEQQAILDQCRPTAWSLQSRSSYGTAWSARQHYLKNADLVGEQLRYVVTYQGQWVALLGWSAASFHLKDREKWLGWSNLQRRSRLHLLAQNSRFVVLLDRSDWPNLASRSLALVCQRLVPGLAASLRPPDCGGGKLRGQPTLSRHGLQSQYWQLLGQTDGFKRVAEDFYTRHDRPKQLWVKSLVPMLPRLLSAEVLPEPWRAYEKEPPVSCGISCAHLPSLFDRFRGLTDSRKGQGKRHRLATIYAIIACAKLSGIPGGYRASISMPEA